MLENELNAKYEKLDLSDEQQNVIMQWIDAIHALKLLIPLLLSEWGCNAVFLTDAVSRLVKLTEKSAVFQNFLGLGIPLILCFNLVVKGIFSLPLYPW